MFNQYDKQLSGSVPAPPKTGPPAYPGGSRRNSSINGSRKPSSTNEERKGVLKNSGNPAPVPPPVLITKTYESGDNDDASDESDDEDDGTSVGLGTVWSWLPPSLTSEVDTEDQWQDRGGTAICKTPRKYVRRNVKKQRTRSRARAKAKPKRKPSCTKSPSR